MWDPNLKSRLTKNSNGTYGWAIVVESSNAIYGPGTHIRVLICAHNPCRVVYSDTKYGPYGPPVHMQCITCMGPTAAPLLPLTAAPVAEPSSTTTAVDAPSSTTTAVAAYTPTAGAAPIDNAAKHAAMDRVRAAALKLSREIRTPKAWIGYIAFVLFALLKQCRPRVWEGANKFCFIEHFAPWAKNMCPKECAYAAIPCAFRTNPSGVAECVQISDETPLSKMSHYVAGIDIPSAPLTAVAAATLDESAFAAFYKALGVHYLPTVCDGDCGLDVMCLIMGAERSLHERTSLRVELSDYLLQRLHLPWMIDILSVTCELDPDDVKLVRWDEIQVGQELMHLRQQLRRSLVMMSSNLSAKRQWTQCDGHPKSRMTVASWN